MVDMREDAGALVRESVKAAGTLLPVEIVEIIEPGTEAKALVYKGPGGVVGIDPGIFDGYRDTPRRREGIARLTTLDSFISHINRFKSEASAIFAMDNPTAPTLQSVLDYHPEGPADAVGSEPDFGEHRGRYDFPLSDEWKAWKAKNGEGLSMADFAAFLEDHIGDVILAEPGALNEDMEGFMTRTGYENIASPSRLMELSRGLSFNEKSEVREVRNLQSGEAQLLFTAEHVDAVGAPLNIPSLFVVELPVFRFGDYYRLLARLRYRKVGTSIRFSYELWRADKVFDEAFRKAADKAADETGLPLFYGAPE